jgi:ribosomal protein S18 acetylase RimI-like enzyme
MIEVRPVRPEEMDEAGRVTALAYREFAGPGDTGWERYLGEIADVAGRIDRSLVLVAVEDGRVLGSATLEIDDRIEDDARPLEADEVSLRMLGVDPDARGRGVARALIAACFDEARSRGKRRMTLHTTERMKAAQAMYESLGFDRLPDRVFPDGFVLLTYERAIGEGPGLDAA